MQNFFKNDNNNKKKHYKAGKKKTIKESKELNRVELNIYTTCMLYKKKY